MLSLPSYIRSVTRYCEGCRREHDLDAFDLESNASSSVCRVHTQAREQSARREKIAALEKQRRSHIAALVKLDAELAELRGRGSSPFKRIEPTDVFGDGDSADGDLGFGD